MTISPQSHGTQRLRGAVNDHVTVELQHEGIEMRLTQDIQNLEQQVGGGGGGEEEEVLRRMEMKRMEGMGVELTAFQIMELRRINGDLQFKWGSCEARYVS